MTVSSSGTANPDVKELPVPEPDLTPAEMIGRARALRERLREEQAATEARTYHSAELHEEFVRAGFYRILQPRRFGGYEFSLPTFFQTMIELARGCPSTGWCVTLGSAHVFNVAGVFDIETQASVFGDTGHFVAPCRGVPMGTATATPNGWLVNGRWDYCSGSPYSTHVLNGVMITGDDDGGGDAATGGMPRIGMALVPRADYQIIEDWGDVIGMKGSGSHTTVVENAEVPHGCVVEADLTRIDLSKLVGYEIHGNPMYAGPNTPFFLGEVASCAIGTARAALDEYQAMAREKRTMWPPFGTRANDSHFQGWFGRALMLTDSAEAIMVRVGELYHEHCAESVSGGEPFTRDKESRLGTMVSQAGAMAVEAVDVLIRSAGASALKDGARMQRYWRDMSTYRAHVSNSLREMGYVGSGAVHLGDGEASDGFTLRS